jgi:hypothetical protein
MLACREDWLRLPSKLRRAILAAYVRGQERDLTLITEDYRTALRGVVEWWTANP